MRGEWLECENCLSTFFYEPKRPRNGVFKGVFCVFCGSKFPETLSLDQPTKQREIELEHNLITEIDRIGFIEID